ncbi:MAG: DUF4176 domain-containing protein [Lachnospiraceae bacterium]|nr:DUF4176 domain-containing protein [Lachnospiraceae bacterium]
MEIKDLLPIGSVVTLEEGKKKLMIFGVKQTNEEDGTEYDYLSVMYPEGNMGGETQFLFNHEDIFEVVFKGYEDDERTEFLGHLADFYNNR